MKRLLLSLLAALALPTAVNAESYEAGVARIQWPTMKKLYQNSQKFIEIGDMTAACSKIFKYDTLLEMNFEGLQEIKPDIGWFEVKRITNNMLKTNC